MIEDYNKNMGGVDRSDQLVLSYGYPHRLVSTTYYAFYLFTLHYNRSLKWWKRVFFHLLDLSLVNANILYNKSSAKQMHQLEFRLAVATSLLEGHTPRTDRRHIAPTTVLLL